MGTPYPPRIVRLGCPSTLRQAQREGLQAYLKGKPDAYSGGMRDFLYDEYDVMITASSVYRELEKLRWSRKVAVSDCISMRSLQKRFINSGRNRADSKNVGVLLEVHYCNFRAL